MAATATWATATAAVVTGDGRGHLGGNRDYSYPNDQQAATL